MDVKRSRPFRKIITHVAIPVVALVAVAGHVWYGWGKYETQQGLQKGIQNSGDLALGEPLLLEDHKKKHRLDHSSENKLAEAMNDIGNTYMASDKHKQA